MMLSLDARRQAAIADFVTRIRADLGPHLVDLRLFGSVARRDAHPDSDIDILVVERDLCSEHVITTQQHDNTG